VTFSVEPPLDHLTVPLRIGDEIRITGKRGTPIRRAAGIGNHRVHRQTAVPLVGGVVSGRVCSRNRRGGSYARGGP
jgi:hypothetical protein